MLLLQLLRDEIGFSPLHHACRLENIALARVLIEAESGKRALLLANSDDQKPIELCSSNFMKLRLEGESNRSLRHYLAQTYRLPPFLSLSQPRCANSRSL